MQPARVGACRAGSRRADWRRTTRPLGFFRRPASALLVASIAAAGLAAPPIGAAAGPRGEVAALEAVSESAGELTLRWEPPTDPLVGPSDYRIAWAPDGEAFRTWSDPQWNAYAAAPASQYTITGLAPETSYRVRVRARYNAGAWASKPWSGPWASAGPVRAEPAPGQSASVSVASLDIGDAQAVVLATIEAAASETLWSAPGSRWGEQGRLLGGDVTLGGGSRIVRVHRPVDDGSLLRINTEGPSALGDFFGATGAGADLTVWVHTEGGTASFPANGVSTSGDRFANFSVPQPQWPIVAAIGDGDRFVLALTRPAAEPGSTQTPSTTAEDEGGQGEPGTDVDQQEPDEDGQQVTSVGAKLTPEVSPNLDAELNQLAHDHRKGQTGRDAPLGIGQSEATSGRSTRDASTGAVDPAAAGTVAVEVFFDREHLSTVVRYLRSSGATVRDPLDDEDALVANVPVSLLAELARLRGVQGVVLAQRPELLTAGARAHGAVRWQGAGYGGANTRIGIYDLGYSDYSAHIGSALPTPAGVKCWTANVNVQHTTLAACEAASSTGHGTEVTEMAYDVAPDAEYFLAAGPLGGDLKRAVDWFESNDVDVIALSLNTEFDGPGDGTSPFTNRFTAGVNRAVSKGMVVAIAAGNEHGGAWFGQFVDSDADNVLEWSSGDECNSVRLVSGKRYLFMLRWNGTWRGADTDLDLYVKSAGSVQAKSEDTQSGRTTHNPQEVMGFTPSSTGSFCISVEKRSGSIPSWAQLVIGNPTPDSLDLEHLSEGYSIRTPAETVNSGVLAVGAARHSRTSTIDDYSSRGPLPDGTIKPDIVGATGVNSAVAGQSIDGTSFAAPHVAGLAALVKQRHPWYTPAEITKFLKDHAQRRGDPVPNSTWGFGFAQLGGTPAEGSVTISGEIKVGRTLTASAASVTDDDDLEPTFFRWQWYRVDGTTRTAITGAANTGATSSYRLTDADEGKAVAARLQFTDYGGNREDLFSSPSAIVAGASTTLVSNIANASRPDHITLVAGRRIAQPFRTGFGAIGYTVREVSIDVAQALPSDASYTVAIHAAGASRGPGSRVATLTGSLASSGEQFFEPSSTTTLDPGTTYYLVIDVTSLGDTQPLVNAYIHYKRRNIDYVTAPGWRLISPSYYRSSGDTAWTQYSHDWGFSVKGDVVPADNTVSFSHSTYSAVEGTSASVVVELARPAAKPLTIPVIAESARSTAGSGDYSGLPTDVRFGTGDTRKTVSIPAVQDTGDDDDEFVYLTFGDLPSGIVSVASFAYLFIIDDDLPDVTVAFDSASYEADEGGSVSIGVELSALPERGVEIPIVVYDREAASADSTFVGDLDDWASSVTDYSGVPGTLRFASDQTRRTFTFRVTEETANDDGEQVALSFGTLPAQVTADPTVHSGEAAARDRATITLVDNDLPDVKVRFGVASRTVAEGQTILIPVELDRAPERQISIPISTTAQGGIATADYILVPSADVTFEAAETRKTISFTAYPDSDTGEEGEGLVLAFGTTLPQQVTVDAAIPAGETSPRSTATVTITDVVARPGPPSIDAITARSRNLIVTWSAPTANGGAEVTRYHLRYIESSETPANKADPANWTRVNDVWETGGGDLTFRIRGLGNGRSYDVQVAARNSAGTSQWSETETGTPFLANVDPEFPASETGTRTVSEDAAVGDNIGAPVSAADEDSATLYYALKAESDHISIVEASGQLQVKAPLDHETDASHVVTVTVSDRANANDEANVGIDDEIEVTITVTNVNEAPAVTGETAIVVAENTTGVLAAYTADDPEDETITAWSLGGSDAAAFAVDDAGRLSFATPPDFENPADADANNEYRVRVRAKDARKTGRLDVVVTVTAVDEAPVIAGDAAVSFPENSLLAVETYTATDPEGREVFWRDLSGDDADLFELSAAGELRFLSPPDFESPGDAGADNSYEVTLEAADLESGGLTGTLDVVVTVTQVLEPPTISGERALNFLEETTGTVAAYTVSDPEGTNTSFTWTLEGADRSLFSLTSAGAAATLAFANPPDFETPADSGGDNSYEVTVKVTANDNSVGTLRALVIVTNANDAPTITGGPTQVTVAEDVTGTIATYTATDPERAPIQWSVSGTDAADFTINDMGELRFATGADAETQTSHSITVTASDGDATNPLTATRNVAVTVTGVDEPAEIGPAGDVAFAENSTATVVTFTASDPEGMESTFTFSLAGDDSDDFTLTSAGVLTFASPPDFEAPTDADSDNEYRITVRAGGGSLDLTVTVTDTNEPPVITPAENITRQENSTGTVASYSAADPEGLTHDFTWSLAGDDADDFVLHPESGYLTFASPPDYEAPADADGDNVYRLTIEVTDDDLPNSIEVTVTVTDVNEAPAFSGESAMRSVEENAATGDVGAAVTASDGDSDTLTYSVTATSEPDGAANLTDFERDFAVGAGSGQVSVRSGAAIDYETRASYTVLLEVSDSKDQAGLADTAVDDTVTLTISVTNLDEAGSVTVTGALEAGETLEATLADPDGSLSNQSWVWESAESASGPFSAIVGADTASYEVAAGDVGDYVRARVAYDDGQGTAKDATSLAQGPVREANAAPAFLDETATRSISENAITGDVGAAVTAADVDDTALTYSAAATSEPDGADHLIDFNRDFQLGSSSGQVSVRSGAAIDYEARSSYEVLLQVSDGKNAAGKTDTAIDDTLVLTITVADLDEPGSVTVTGTLQAGETLAAALSDPDGSLSSQSWTWEKSATADGTYSAIPGADATSYELAAGDVDDWVRATVDYTDGNGAGKSASSPPRGPVVAANAAPEFSDETAARSVAENTASGDVGDAVAADDVDDATLTYSVAATSEPDGAAHLADFDRDFELGASSGQVSIRSGAQIDYETRSSYEVLLRVSDGKDAAGQADEAIDDTLVLTITVTNLDEPGSVTVSGTLESGETLAASLSDPDGTLSALSWAWEHSSTSSGPWSAITGADAASYELAAGDLGDFVRARASYTDGHGAGKSATSPTQGPVEAANASPAFSDAAATRSVSEGAAAGDVGAAVTAADLDDTALTYSVAATSEADAAANLADFRRDFAVGAASGQVSVRSGAQIDYETRSSYTVLLRVSDGKDAAGDADAAIDDTLVLTISVTNVDEAGSASVSGTVKAGATLAASLSDPDGSLSNQSWAWEKSSTASGPWTAISGATGASYGLAVGDLGSWVRAVASYADGHGAGKSATSPPRGPVVAANTAPGFPGATAARTVSENAASGDVGAAVTAADSERDTLAYSVSETSDSDAAANLADFNRDFEVGGSGQVSVRSGAQIDYEARSSYKVLLQVSDGKDAAGQADAAIDDTLVLTISVTNLDEPGSASVSGTLRAGETLAASLTDPDGSLSNQSWTWERSATADGTFTAISGAHAASYELHADDVGNYVRARAAYTDGHGSNKSAMSPPQGPVGASNTAPSFPDAMATRSVLENAAMGGVGAAVAAADSENDSLTYSVTATSDGGAAANLADFNRDFAVGASSGQVSVRSGAQIDYETRSSYKVLLHVSDGKNAAGEADNAVDATVTLTISVTNLDEAGSASVSGTLEAGETLDATLSDPDGSPSAESWAWEKSSSSSGPWSAISGAAGKSYKLEAANLGGYVRARVSYTDGHGAGKSAISPAQGPIGAANAAPEFSGETAARSVSENAVTGDVGAAVTADDGETDALAYSVAATSEPDGAANLADFGRDFAVGASSGQVSVRSGAQIDYETRSSYKVLLQVSDGKDAAGDADTATDDTVTLTISVTNLDEAGSATVSGTLEAGEALAASLTDPDGSLTAVSWAWEKSSTSSGPWSAISGATGASYELAAGDVGSWVRAVASYADGHGSSKSATSPPQGPVGAANTAPGFPDVTATRTVTENATMGDLGAAVAAVDRESDGLTYSVAATSEPDGAANLADFNRDFAVGASSGQVSVRSGAQIDFETRSSYKVLLQVSDKKDEAGNSDDVVDDELALAITVTDADEAGTVTVTGTLEAGEMLAATLSDPDGSLSSLSWTWERSATADGIFTAISGAVGSSYELDTDDIGGYVRARASYTDGLGAGKAATSPARGPVRAANAAPAFSDETATRSVSENAIMGDVGTPVAAADGESDGLTYSVAATSEPDAAANLADFDRDFVVGAASGQVSVRSGAQLDYETRSSYTVLLQVSDGKDAAGDADAAIDDTVTLTISVTNLDEAGSVAVSGTLQAGETLAASLSDPDGSVSNQSWVWESASSASGPWSAISGADAASYALAVGDLGGFVRAVASYRDGEGSGKSARSSALGPIEAANAAPDFSGETATRSVSENATSGDVGTALTAADEDDATLSYSVAATTEPDGADDLSDFNRDFAVGASSGQVSVRSGAQIDYETRSSYTVLLRVSDGKDAAGQADAAVDDTLMLTITVTNADEAGSVEVSGTLEGGETLAATLSDPDGSAAVQAWAWERAAASDGPWVAISGAHTASYELGADDVGAYVRAVASYTDGHGSGKSATSPARGRVEAANTEPSFSDETAVRSVNENTASGNVGDAIAAADGENDALTYSVVATTDEDGADHLSAFNRDFAVGASSGQVSVRSGARIDYETRATYRVLYRVSDSKDAAGRPDTAVDDAVVLTIAVTDADEAGSVEVSGTLEAGASLAAALSDPDGSLSSVSWTWEKSSTASGPWSAISGAHAASYELAAQDVGDYVRAVVSYTDGHGSDKSAISPARGPVRAAGEAPDLRVEPLGGDLPHDSSSAGIVELGHPSTGVLSEEEDSGQFGWHGDAWWLKLHRGARFRVEVTFDGSSGSDRGAGAEILGPCCASWWDDNRDDGRTWFEIDNRGPTTRQHVLRVHARDAQPARTAMRHYGPYSIMVTDITNIVKKAGNLYAWTTGFADVVNNASSDKWLATSFTTGDESDGFKLDWIGTGLRAKSGASRPKAALYTDLNGSPGTKVFDLERIEEINDVPSSKTEHRFWAPDDATDLAADTTYWVVFRDANPNATYRVAWADDGNDDRAMLWTIGNTLKSYNADATSPAWQTESATRPLSIVVHAADS